MNAKYAQIQLIVLNVMKLIAFILLDMIQPTINIVVTPVT